MEPTPPPTILVVDDEPSNRFVAERVLRGAGYDVLIVADALEALRAIEVRGAFSLYVIDIMMPALRGTDLADRIRQSDPDAGLLVLEGQPPADHPIVLSEFGGITCATDPGKWGYSRCGSEQLADRYATLLRTVRSLDLLAGFCYTQFADTYQEANGLLHADRRPKFPLALMSEATSGSSRPV